MKCTECLGNGAYWTEAAGSVAEMEANGLVVLDDGSKDPDGTVLILCSHCPRPSCYKCNAVLAMNCSIEGCPNI
jgi:hypothetical protein